MAGRKSDAILWTEPDKLIELEGWAREGLTDKQIAEHKVGVSERTFTEWKAKYPTIYSALKKGKAPVDFKVENALYKSAKGFTKTVKRAIKVKTEKQLAGKGKIVEEHIEYVDEEIYIKPDTTAQIFWLKNRKPDKWRDRPEVADVTAIDKLDEILEGLETNASGQAK